ncbi:hypothetical protein [Anaerosolibacter sp.]|uniref:hypothetical protein n=1 Tax=Anaerosolibacter sp. TaxID=1872527 RepID=UPI0039F125B3
MINNKEEKEFVNKQIIHLENALSDLKNRLLPNNPKMFNLMSASYIDKIRELRKEIDLYIGIDENNSVEKSDFIIRLLGPEIGYGRAPISVVTNLLGEVRKGFQNIYAHISGHGISSKYPKSITEMCDLSLVDVFEGSLQVALQRPMDQLNLFDQIETSDFEKTVNLYFNTANLASKQASNEMLKETIPDDYLRDIAMKNVLRIIPKDPKRVSTIEIYGKLVKENIYLTKHSRDYIIDKIAKKQDEEVLYTYKGRIREIDLDKRSFRLRDLANDELINEVVCIIDDNLLDDLKESLDEMAIVKGTITNETKNNKTLRVRFIEASEDTD